MSDIKNIILNSPEGTCLNNHIHLLNNIDYIAERIKEVPGDIVECGVWKGAMLSYMATVFTNRTIWAYDSFAGVPSSKEQTKYPHKYSSREINWETCCPELAADISFLHATLAKYEVPNLDRIHIVQGWFKDTLPTATQQIALLRVDGDLYSSTYEVLEYLYPLVVTGGFVIFDDYCIPESREAVHDYFCNIKELPKFYDTDPHICENLYMKFENECCSHNLDSVGTKQGIFIQK
jgi:hypothetical protein